MSDKSFFAHSILPAVTGAIVRVAKVAGNAWVAWQHRRAVASLYAYDDRMLRDIGLTRHDLTSAMASNPFGDPSMRLDTLARERREGSKAQRREAVAEARGGGGGDGGRPAAEVAVAEPLVPEPEMPAAICAAA